MKRQVSHPGGRGKLARVFCYSVGLIIILVASLGAFAPTGALLQEKINCFECHGRKGLTKKLEGGQEISLFVDKAELLNSIHRELTCLDCHVDAGTIPHHEALSQVDCGRCHEESEVYLQSIHGLAFERGDLEAPNCANCHGKHDILGVHDPRSSVARGRITEICVGCHEDEEIVSHHDLPEPAQIKFYEKSVHGGTRSAAVCVDCHGTHNIEPADDPRSEIFKPHIPKVCGKCHVAIAEEYAKSVHGTAIADGILDAPVCTDCHGEHTITAPTEPTSKVAAKNIPTTCAACHEDVALAEKYHFPARRYTTYLNSFHGVANKYGKTVVANCASCHGVHDILPSADPASKTHRGNLVATCGGCHPDAGENILVGGKIHVEATRESSPGTFYVRRFYTWFITILMVGFVFYMIVETYGRLKRRREASRNENP